MYLYCTECDILTMNNANEHKTTQFYTKISRVNYECIVSNCVNDNYIIIDNNGFIHQFFNFYNGVISRAVRLYMLCD